MKTLTAKEAAAVIGCSSSQVLYLIRRGTLQATKVSTDCNQYGYRYSIFLHEAKRYAKQPQVSGFPRGRSRKEYQK